MELDVTKEEEGHISAVEEDSTQAFEECSLSLFGKLLTNRKQNIWALKNTLRSGWKISPNLQIVEMGNNILQIKFTSEFQI